MSLSQRHGVVALAAGALAILSLCDCGNNQPCPKSTFSDLNTNLFSVSCTLSSCHQAGAGSSVGNLDLATDPYKALLGANGQGVAATDPVGYSYTYNGMLLVKPGDSSKSLMYLKMTLGGATGCPQTACKYGEQMPYASGTLPQCYLDAVKQWIDAGALNN
jgi:hypothetical protein